MVLDNPQRNYKFKIMEKSLKAYKQSNIILGLENFGFFSNHLSLIYRGLRDLDPIRTGSPNLS